MAFITVSHSSTMSGLQKSLKLWFHSVIHDCLGIKSNSLKHYLSRLIGSFVPCNLSLNLSKTIHLSMSVFFRSLRLLSPTFSHYLSVCLSIYIYIYIYNYNFSYVFMNVRNTTSHTVIDYSNIYNIWLTQHRRLMQIYCNLTEHIPS